MFLNVIQMAEDLASAATMVEMKTEKWFLLCVNIILTYGGKGGFRFAVDERAMR